MKSFPLLSPLLALGWLLAAPPAWAQTPARAQTPQCTPGNELALREEVARSVAFLKVASYRADGVLMKDATEKLEVLLGPAGSCPEAMKDRLCDADCYYQRASVYLFQATDMRLLSAKGSSSDGVTAPSQLLREAEAGLRLVEQGLHRLPRQQRGGDDAEKKDLAFNTYLKASARLSTLKAQLLMAAGDIWYRQASVSRVESLNYLVGKALGNGPPANGRTGSEYANAMTRYDEAFWVLMEARGGLPEQGDLFSSELSALAAAEQAVSLRLQSLRKGFLYLNIDPDDFTFMSIGELGRLLREQTTALKMQEDKIQDLMESWSRRYGESKSQEFDAANATHGRAIEVELHKLAQLQDAAEGVKADIQEKLNTLQGEMSRFERQQRIRAIEMDLQRETKELNHQLTVIQGQKEQDLLALRKEAVRDAMSDIQFNIDMTLAALNFEMQIAGINLQVDELKNRMAADDKDLALIANQKKQTQKQLELEQRRVEAAGLIIDRIQQARETVFKSARVPIVQNICAIDAQLAFYKGSAQGYSDESISGASCAPPSGGPRSSQELTKSICDARKKLKTVSQDEIKKLRLCLSGGSCPSGSESVTQTVKKAYEQNLAVFAAQKAGIQLLEMQARELRQKLSTLRIALVALRGATEASDAIAIATQAASAAADGEEGVGMGLTGPFTFKTFKAVHAVTEAARVAAEGAVRVLERRFGDLQFLHQLDQEEAQLTERITELDNTLKNFNAQQAFEAAMRDRTLAEVGVQQAELDKESVLLENEHAIQELQCEQEGNELNATIGRLQSERASLVAKLQSQAHETDLSQLDIKQQENLRAQSQLEISRLQLAMEGLDVQAAKVLQDKTNLGRMQGALERQRQTVDGYHKKVQGLETRFAAERANLQAIHGTIEKNTLQLAEQEKAFIHSVIDDRQVAAFEQLASERKRLEQIDGAQGLNTALNTLEKQLRAATQASRENIINMTMKAPQSQAGAVFWDFENLQAELSRGAPEFIGAKRRLLENINFTYNLYRNRYNMLTRFATDVPELPADKTFVSNSGDVDTLLSTCGTTDAGAVCQPDSLTWSKLTITGLGSEFMVDKNSGLFQQLLSEGHVQFEISPFARSIEDSRNLGSFVLWDRDKMSDAQRMLLVHAVIGVEGAECSQQVTLRHLGTGATFAKLSADNPEPVRSLVVHRPTESVLTVFGSAELGGMKEELAKFRGGAPYTALGLEQRVGGALNVYPFVGYPLVATYELIADENLRRCLGREGAALRLNFIFVRK